VTAIYLDHNATTPVDAQVLEAMLPFLRGEFGNPSSSYALGHRAHAAVERARGEVAALIGAEPEEIVFTGGATEASN
jgi:cysteine desulfurase